MSQKVRNLPRVASEACRLLSSSRLTFVRNCPRRGACPQRHQAPWHHASSRQQRLGIACSSRGHVESALTGASTSPLRCCCCGLPSTSAETRCCRARPPSSSTSSAAHPASPARSAPWGISTRGGRALPISLCGCSASLCEADPRPRAFISPVSSLPLRLLRYLPPPRSSSLSSRGRRCVSSRCHCFSRRPSVPSPPPSPPARQHYGTVSARRRPSHVTFGSVALHLRLLHPLPPGAFHLRKYPHRILPSGPRLPRHDAHGRQPTPGLQWPAPRATSPR